MRFDIKEYSNDDVRMHCETEDEAVVFLEYLEQFGVTWASGSRLSAQTLFDRYGDKTVYNFYHIRKVVAISHIEYYQESDIKEFSDFEWDGIESEPNSYMDLFELLENE